MLGFTYDSMAREKHARGDVVGAEADFERAARWYAASLAGRRVHLGLQNKETIETIFNLGLLKAETGDATAAIALLEEGLAAAESAPGTLTSAQLVIHLNNLSVYYSRAGQLMSTANRRVLETIVQLATQKQGEVVEEGGVEMSAVAASNAAATLAQISMQSGEAVEAVVLQLNQALALLAVVPRSKGSQQEHIAMKLYSSVAETLDGRPEVVAELLPYMTQLKEYQGHAVGYSS